MEHLSEKPYFLTDEDILWIGTTLADMMPTECADAMHVKRVINEGYAAMMRCDKCDDIAMQHYQSCIDAGVLYARVPLHAYEESFRILRDQLSFTGIIYHDESKLRDEIIQILSLQAALGLHKT